MINKNYPINITKKQIFLLSAPIFFSNLAIPLTGIIDTGLMGNVGETKYLAATSISTSVMSLIIWSFAFLRMGTVGIVSQLYARSDYREISKTLLRNLLIAFIISVIIILFKSKILHYTRFFFPTSVETYELMKTYISVRIFSIPAEFIIYILIGFFLGIQKTQISSLIVIVLSLINICFSSILVLSYNLNILGVALGTLIANYLTAIIFLAFTYNFIVKKFQIAPNLQKIIVTSKIIKLLNINFNIFIRTVLLTFAFLWFTYLGTRLGEDFLAINAILLQFLILTSFVLDAYAFSTESIIGFALGRRNLKAFTLAVRNSLQLSFFTALFISFIYLIFYKQIINIMTDIEILRFISYKHAFWIILLPPFASFCYQLDGIFVGASQTREIRDAMIISVIVFIIISIYLTQFLGNHGLWISLILFMIIRSLSLNYFFQNIVKRF